MVPTSGPVKRLAIYTFSIMILLGSLVSCGKHKTYWLHLRPQPTGEQGVTTNLTIGVLPFEDGRISTQKLGARVLGDGREEPIRLESSSASEDVTNLLHRSLKARNITVVTISTWNPTPQNLKDLPPEVDVAIAGKIEALEVKAQSSTLKTTIRYRVKLSAKLGLKAQGKVVTKTIEVRPEETVMRFERQKVEETLNEAVASALNRLVETALASSS
ncbi:MAG: hypothetical protein PVG97_07215 [Syntrophobacterales bacterium]|jgi:hypothetical protein